MVREGGRIRSSVFPEGSGKGEKIVNCTKCSQGGKDKYSLLDRLNVGRGGIPTKTDED